MRHIYLILVFGWLEKTVVAMLVPGKAAPRFAPNVQPDEPVECQSIPLVMGIETGTVIDKLLNSVI